MVNETEIINNTIESVKNSGVVQKFFSFTGEKISELSLLAIQKLSEYGAEPSPILPKLFALFIGLVMIFIGLKIGKKVVKLILLILGIVIIISIIFSFLR